MAVIAVSNHWDGSTGRHERAHGTSYVAKYRIWTNDSTDQAQVVLDWVRSNLVPPGSLYKYAGDLAAETASRARAKNYFADRDLGSNTVWVVGIEYVNDTGAEDEGETIDGNPTENPLLFRPLIKWSTVRYTEPVTKARYRGGFHGTAAALRGPDGKLGAVTNSAGVAFNPGLERDANHSFIQVTMNVATFDADAADGYQNALNALGFSIEKYGFSIFVGKWCGKIGDTEAEMRRQAGVDFFAVTTTIEVNRKTWNDDIADMGMHARARPGDLDGRGGIISPGDIVPGVPQVRHQVDLDELPVSEPILLDGDGQPLTGSDPVYVTYQKYVDEVVFSTIPWIAPIFKGD